MRPTDEELFWLNNASRHGGGFVMNFALACLHADDSNFPIMKPVLVHFMRKYTVYSAAQTETPKRGK